jgi:hypothetical protein
VARSGRQVSGDGGHKGRRREGGEAYLDGVNLREMRWSA